METDNKSKIQFKIGMIAPSGSGKTSLISAICDEIQKRLSTDSSLEFWPVGTATQQAIQRANAVFNTAINNPSNLFQVPKLQPTADVSEFEFAVTLPKSKQEICFSILDYPGHYLGRAEFSRTVTPHLLESAALFVPISADILEYWNDTNGCLGTYNAECNAVANYMLDCENVVSAVKNWIAQKREVGAPAQLFFVPIKCEKYFKDNGGDIDDHEKLTAAILERYIKPLEMTSQDKSLIQTNIFYVDTYGVVELRNIDAVMAKDKEGKDQLTLVPTFRRRMSLGKNRRTKNAYELLMSILQFQVKNRFKLQQAETSEKDAKRHSTENEVKSIRRKLDNAQNEISKRKDSYTWWDKFWYSWVSSDKDLGRLEDEAEAIEGHLGTATGRHQAAESEYQFSAQECQSLEAAVKTLDGLFQNMENRQITP